METMYAAMHPSDKKLLSIIAVVCAICFVGLLTLLVLTSPLSERRQLQFQHNLDCYRTFDGSNRDLTEAPLSSDDDTRRQQLLFNRSAVFYSSKKNTCLQTYVIVWGNNAASGYVKDLTTNVVVDVEGLDIKNASDYALEYPKLMIKKYE